MATHAQPNGLVRWRALGKAIRNWRTKHNEGLREFARRTEIDKAVVCRAEQGKVLTVGSYFALCMACDLDPWDYIKQH